jgi:hypothetical protein
MLCPKCGKEVKIDAKFCNSCGGTLNREAEKRAPSVSAPAPEKKAKRRVVIFGVIAIITISAAILAVVLFEFPLLLVAIGVGVAAVISGVWLFSPPRIRLWVLAGIILLIVIAITMSLIARPKISRINLPEPVIIATVPIAGKDAVLTRTLAFAEKSNGQYIPRIVLSLDNFSPQTKSNITVTEYIPKDFAQHVGDIEFSVPPTRILADDAVVEWQIAELKPGEQKAITYYPHQTMPGPAVDNAVQVFHQLFQQATYFDDYSQITAIKSYLGVPSFELPEEAKTSEFLNRFYNIYYYPYDWMYFNYTFKQNPLAYFQDQKEGMLENANRYVAQASFAQDLKTYYDFIGLYGAINEAKPLGTIDKLYSIYKDLGFPESFIADDAQFIYQTVESAKDLAKTPDIIDDPDARKSTFDALFDQILMKQVEDQQRLDKLRAVRYGADVQVLKELIPLHEKAERGLVTENEAKALASLEIKHYIFQREVIKAEIEFLEWAINHVDLSDVIFGWWFPDASKNNLQRRLDAYRDLETYFSVSAEVRAKAITDVINNPAVPSSQPPLSASPEEAQPTPEAQPSATPQQSSGSSPGKELMVSYESTVHALYQCSDSSGVDFNRCQSDALKDAAKLQHKDSLIRYGSGVYTQLFRWGIYSWRAGENVDLPEVDFTLLSEKQLPSWTSPELCGKTYQNVTEVQFATSRRQHEYAKDTFFEATLTTHVIKEGDTLEELWTPSSDKMPAQPIGECYGLVGGGNITPIADILGGKFSGGAQVTIKASPQLSMKGGFSPSCAYTYFEAKDDTGTIYVLVHFACPGDFAMDYKTFFYLKGNVVKGNNDYSLDVEGSSAERDQNIIKAEPAPY